MQPFSSPIPSTPSSSFVEPSIVPLPSFSFPWSSPSPVTGSSAKFHSVPQSLPSSMVPFFGMGSPPFPWSMAPLPHGYTLPGHTSLASSSPLPTSTSLPSILVSSSVPRFSAFQLDSPLQLWFQWVVISLLFIRAYFLPMSTILSLLFLLL